MRIKSAVNVSRDLGRNARLHNLDELRARARACNLRILELSVPARAPSSRARGSGPFLRG